MKTSIDNSNRPEIQHELFKNSGLDCEGSEHSWEFCKVCGATKHSQHFWLGGYKSKMNPPCIQYPVNQPALIEWQKQATLQNYKFD
jgi:hypothetical protein